MLHVANLTTSAQLFRVPPGVCSSLLDTSFLRLVPLQSWLSYMRTRKSPCVVFGLFRPSDISLVQGLSVPPATLLFSRSSCSFLWSILWPVFSMPRYPWFAFCTSSSSLAVPLLVVPFSFLSHILEFFWDNSIPWVLLVAGFWTVVLIRRDQHEIAWMRQVRSMSLPCPLGVSRMCCRNIPSSSCPSRDIWVPGVGPTDSNRGWLVGTVFVVVRPVPRFRRGALLLLWSLSGFLGYHLWNRYFM